MQTSPQDGVRARGLADIPAGETAQGFVAHTMMALIACHLRMTSMVDLHVARALDIIDKQSDRLKTVRGKDDTSLVHVLTRAGDMSATLLLPMIGGLVISPTIDFETVALSFREHRGCSAPVILSDIGIEHVGVRLRTARLKTAFQKILEIESLESRADLITDVLKQCLLPTLKPVAPLNVADEFFDLARRFAQLENHALSRLALQKAEFHIRLYADSTDNEEHRRLSEGLTRKIGGLVDCLGASAS